MKPKRKRFLTLLLFLGLHIIIAMFSFSLKLQWFYDILLALALLLVLFFVAKWLSMDTQSLFLASLALFLHNLGTFGLYGTQLWIFSYDNFVHFTSSGIVAYLCCHFFVHWLHFKRDTRVHMANLLFFAFATVIMFSVMVEIIEFAGHLLQTSGFSFAGVDAEDGREYKDTMTDIISNLFGSIAGVFLYHKIKYKKKVTNMSS